MLVPNGMEADLRIASGLHGAARESKEVQHGVVRQRPLGIFTKVI
jgi:hypothetical protein